MYARKQADHVLMYMLPVPIHAHHHQVDVAGASTADGHDAYSGMYLCAHPAMYGAV